MLKGIYTSASMANYNFKFATVNTPVDTGKLSAGKSKTIAGSYSFDIEAGYCFYESNLRARLGIGFEIDAGDIELFDNNIGTYLFCRIDNPWLKKYYDEPGVESSWSFLNPEMIVGFNATNKNIFSKLGFSIINIVSDDEATSELKTSFEAGIFGFSFNYRKDNFIKTIDETNTMEINNTQFGFYAQACRLTVVF